VVHDDLLALQRCGLRFPTLDRGLPSIREVRESLLIRRRVRRIERDQARYADFSKRWATAIKRWEAKAAPLKGKKVIVHHISWVYLNKWLGLVQVGALEPKPGVPPTSGHLAELISIAKTQGVSVIISAAYQDPKPAAWLQERTGVHAVVLPFTVGGDAQAKDLFGLYDSTIDKLLAAAK
jgi:zinc/manganese transport system substrate-binding protein